MRTESLAYFLEIAESGSFTHAAKRLYISQQGLSKAIKALEGSLGCRLFQREGSQLNLSEAGRALVPHARRCLKDIEGLQVAMRPFGSDGARHDGRGADATLHAAAFVADSLFSLLEADLRAAGLSDVRIIEHSYTEMLSALEEGAPSLFALCLPLDEVSDFKAIPQVEFRPLFTTEIMLAGSPRLIHPQQGAFSLESVAEMPIVYYNDFILNRIICEMFRDRPLQNVITHASCLSRITRSIQQGDAVTFSDSLSVYLSDGDEGVAYAPIQDAAELAMGFAYRVDRDVPRSALEYMDAFSRCFRTRCAPYLEKRPLPAF